MPSLAGIMDLLHEEDDLFKPKHFLKFMLSGDFQRLRFESNSSVKANPKSSVFIVGCGRSGTTLCYSLLKDSSENVFGLDEPRELYLNFWTEQFDVWSKQSFDRKGQLSSLQETNKLGDLYNSLFNDLGLSEADSYLEKMPEHLFRVPQVLEALPAAKFIYMQRDWM